MSLPNPKDAPRWRMTSAAWSALNAELDRLDRELEQPADPDIVRLPSADPAQRRQALLAIRDAAAIDDEPGVAVIGRRVSIREADGSVESYSLVLPGDGDPAQGWISVDSPLGSAVLGARPNRRVEVHAPAGRREVEVVAID